MNERSANVISSSLPGVEFSFKRVNYLLKLALYDFAYVNREAFS